MTKDEKRQVSELIMWAVDITAGMARDWDPNMEDWEKRHFHAMWDNRKNACQDQIKELTGVYVPVG